MQAFLRPGPGWYASGLRWIAALMQRAALALEAWEPEPMPRHTSCEEILADLRNRINRP